MGKDISHLIIGGNENEDGNSRNLIGALGNLEHFGEKEKERGIVIIVGGHDDIGMHTARLLASNIAHEHIILAQDNELDNSSFLDYILAQKPDPTIENFIKQMGDDLEKRMSVMRDDIDSYKLLQDADINHKKAQEKRRRIHLQKKKVSPKKKG